MMYQAIKKHAPVLEKYAQSLISEGTVSQEKFKVGLWRLSSSKCMFWYFGITDVQSLPTSLRTTCAHIYTHTHTTQQHHTHTHTHTTHAHSYTHTDLESWQRRTWKRVGLFTEMGYTTIGDPYVPPNSSECSGTM